MRKLFIFFVMVGIFSFVLNGADNEPVPAPAGKIVPLPELTKATKLAVFGDEVFVVNDRYTVMIYSAPDFKLKRQFGKKGAGPGEFKRPIRLSILPDFILVDSQDRLSWFSREGKLLKQKNKSTGSRHIPFKDNFIVKSVQFLSRQKSETKFRICDSEFNEINVLHKFSREIPLLGGPNAPPIKEWQMVHPYYDIHYDAAAGKIFVFDSSKGFYINVFDEKGQNLYTIDKTEEIGNTKVPDEYKDKKNKEFKDSGFWRELREPEMVYPKYFPAYEWAAVDKGKIYIQTFKRKNDRARFFVLNLEGKVLKEIYLPVVANRDHTVSDGTLYNLVENEETETWELHIYKM